MVKKGKGGGAPGKGNPGGERGGNRGGSQDEKRSSSGPRNSQQAAGADPHRGRSG